MIAVKEQAEGGEEGRAGEMRVPLQVSTEPSVPAPPPRTPCTSSENAALRDPQGQE